MADPEHLTYAQQGSEAWNSWRRTNPGIKPDLTGASLCDHQWGNARMAYVDLSLSTLKKTNLRGGDFWRTDLNHSDLSQSDLSRSYFGRAQLHSANLSGADLSTARFVGSDLSGANLTHTKIFHSHFYDTDLSGTDFSHAWVKETTFANVDLSKAKGLDSVKFIGPSSLGVDSIYRSHGLIPTLFLRGCGVPEEFINTIPSLTFSSNLEFSCFLCHSGMDRVFCEKLFSDLQANGIRCWLLPDDFAKGRGAHFKAHNPDLIYDKLLVICSKHALASDPVIREIERALESQDRGERTRLLSITRDDFLADKWSHPNKARVAQTLCSDFRHWEKPESYERALGKLLAALKSF